MIIPFSRYCRLHVSLMSQVAVSHRKYRNSITDLMYLCRNWQHSPVRGVGSRNSVMRSFGIKQSLRFSLLCFFNWYSGGGVQLGPLHTAATNRPTVPAPGDYNDGEIGGKMIVRETEVLGENLPQCRFVYHKTHTLPGREHGPLRWEASDSLLC
jgi:hypothetical protein